MNNSKLVVFAMATFLLAVLFLASVVPELHSAQKPATPNPMSTFDARHKQFLALLDEEWQYEMRSSPEFATSVGDNRYNDRWSDYSPEFFQSDIEQRGKFLARFEAIDATGFSQQDALSLKLTIRELKEQIEGAQFKNWEMPVNQRDGPQVDLPYLISLMPFNSLQDYENYLSRLRQISRVFEQITANMSRGLSDRLMPPGYLLDKVSSEAEEVAKQTGESSPFFGPLKQFPAGFSTADQKRLRKDALNLIATQIIPAYQKFAAFVRDEYAPHGRTDPGVWSLPDGEARYRYAIKRMTTTEMTPDQIHEIGMQQLHETEAEMLAVARKFGFNDLSSFNQHIKDDRKLYATSGQQVLDLYAKYAADMEPELPRLFGHLPKAKLIAVPMEPSRSPSGTPADYSPGTPDGSRPGHINVNEYDPQHRLLLNVEAIAYHEGVPGHHLQISLAQELPDLPDFRQHAGYTAYVEGWAFYAERLGKDVGRYQDPYNEYGRLENEMWRDIRLVVDTGVHAKHWSRDQMVEYFHKYTAMDEPNIQTEVDRYIGWPAQALAYKVGQLQILKLRDEARQRLGDKFDIRAFHDEVLGNGPLPLDVLQSEVENWIAEENGVNARLITK
ncbi:MAG TPA: DUF885 domain-containing protein [Terriglobales bacterium]|nr:DUF885 domain-containing protein [Terriglobales bacterium]